MNLPTNTRQIVAKEFRHGYHLKAIPSGPKARPDTHVVKERVHYNDDTHEDRLVTFTDLKRPFYVTKKIFRTHKQARETEFLEKLDKFECTDSQLNQEISRRLGMKLYGNIQYRQLTRSPYLYGSDVSAQVLLKQEYRTKYDKITPYTVTFFDIENDVDTGVISVITGIRRVSSTQIEVFTVVNSEEIPLIVDLKKRVISALLDNLPDNLPVNFDPSHLVFDIRIQQSELETIKVFFEMMHIWGTDFLSAWNANYDITNIFNAILKYGSHPEDYFTDPNLPAQFRELDFKEGRKVKKTQAGKETSIDPEKQWHKFNGTAKFYMIDAMASYYFIRVGGKEIQGGYSLNNVLTKELKFGKLKFKDLTDLTNAEWHRYMLRQKPIEYLAYNIWDVLGLIFLEDKNKDLSLTLPLLIDKSLFDDFARSSKILMDDFHFAALEEGMVIGSQVPDEEYEGSLGRKDWTVTLEPWRNVHSGYNIFSDVNLFNNLHLLTYDMDAVSAYPRATIVNNLSKTTTAREVISIGNIPKEEFKRANMNLVTGEIAHVDYCVSMFNFPDAISLSDLVAKKLGGAT